MKSLRKNIRVSVVAMLLLIMSFVITTVPVDASMINRAWARQTEGIAELLQAWENNSDNATFDKAIFKIVSAEVNLLAYDANPNNTNLVHTLVIENGVFADRAVIAYRILKNIMKQKTNYEPDPWASFKGRIFRGISTTTTESSEQYDLRFDYK